MKRTLLVDGDILAFTVSARVETKVNWGDDVVTREADFDVAKREAESWLKEMKADLHADEVIVAMSDPARRYFRNDIYPLYKAHRTHGETPLLLFELKKHIHACPDFKPYMRPRLEADDILGILATHPTLVEGEKIVVTADKDLNQIAGLHYNPRKPKDYITEVGHFDADQFFYTQVLTGDPTDGFPGCPRIGPVKAKKILGQAECDAGEGDPHSMLFTCYWKAIVAAYDAKGLDEAYALTQARVARILRWTDYDYTNKRPILWIPYDGYSPSSSSPTSPSSSAPSSA